MTPVERQQLRRDRRKAGLVRLEVWLPQAKFEMVANAIDRMLSEDDGLNEVSPVAASVHDSD